ncbi:sugar-binding transcriptional regulator [Arthrobacter silvisoli]|uniref:sugar-binding transcriptional regulator n=1 Tax=Arthrobacter silvisoli TaxID=2291022 RepID=UPI000E20F8BC|nr:sugar-binding domain-containing protein [Arthrobacter silvisoli]
MVKQSEEALAGLSHRELLAHVGRDYYLENMPKVDIASRYNISRFQVARLLEEARATGIVDIVVHFPSERADTGWIESLLGIQHVVVVDPAVDELHARTILGKAAAKEIARIARAGTTIGISWSRTLDIASHHIESLPKSDIVQLAGALPTAGDGNPMEIIQRLGRLSGGRTWPLWAPLVVDDVTTATGLLRQPEIAEALAKGDSLDLAVVAVGAWKPNESTVWERVDNKVRRKASESGAVSECSGRLLDADGQPVVTELDARVIAVTVDQLKRTPQVIAVAQGAARAEAVRAAAKAGFITTLIIDRPLAAALAGTSDKERNNA